METEMGISKERAQPSQGDGPTPQLEDAPHDALQRIDILTEVFSRLGSVAELAAAALVGRAWRAAARDDQPWRHVYVRQYGKPHAWEACSSYREQCRRHVGLRWPQHEPPLPGPPAPGAQLEEYDKSYGVRTLAVSYDPVSRSLVRAVRSRALVGDGMRVAVQAIPLDPLQPATSAGQPGAHAAIGGPKAQRYQQRKTAAAVGLGAGSDGAPVPEAEIPATAATVATTVTTLTTEGETTAQVPWAGAASGRESGDGLAARTDHGWVCWLSTDGRQPPPPPAPAGPEDQDNVAAAAAAATAAGLGGSGGGGGEDGQFLTEEGVRQIESLAELLPTVMCCAGGLLYLPAGPMGRGLALWGLTTPTAATTSTTATTTSGNTGATPAAQYSALLPPHQHQQQPYWLVSEAHPGRLLAVAADGAVAVSGCDGGRLLFWRDCGGGVVVAAGSADIGELTQLPVLDVFPQTAGAPSGASRRRHRLRIAVCGAAGVAAVVLTSPLSPKLFIYRATPTRRCRRGHEHEQDDGGGDGDGGGGVGQLLAVQSVHGAPCSGLLLFRNRMLTMQVLSNDVLGARFGGSSGSSVLITVVLCCWDLPGAGEVEDEGEVQKGEQAGYDGGVGAAEAGGGCDGGGAGAGHWSDSWTRLYSSRLQLEHPRSLVLSRMRPVLAASEDLALLSLPRNVGGRPPHSQLLALELPPPPSRGGRGVTPGSADGGVEGDGDEDGNCDDDWKEKEVNGSRGEGGDGGDAKGRALRARRRSAAAASEAAVAPPQAPSGGSWTMLVVSEEERLQWVEVVDDAREVVAAVVPTPRHLALLSEDGRLRLYGIVQGDAVPPSSIA